VTYQFLLYDEPFKRKQVKLNLDLFYKVEVIMDRQAKKVKFV